MSNRVVIEVSRSQFSKKKKSIARAASGALRHLRERSAYVSIFLVTNSEIALLNARFRKKKRPTTVLSFAPSKAFPLPNIPRGVTYIGDIYLAPAYIAEKKMSVERLVVHGLLHLRGYTHALSRDRIDMERLEERIASELRL